MTRLLLTAILVFTASAFGQTSPPEFITQVLEPTGDKILRPIDWFYSEGHHGPVYMWTLSREDTSKNGSYTTGVRIQTFVASRTAQARAIRDGLSDRL